jgi:hypothetical protein
VVADELRRPVGSERGSIRRREPGRGERDGRPLRDVPSPEQLVLQPLQPRTRRLRDELDAPQDDALGVGETPRPPEVPREVPEVQCVSRVLLDRALHQRRRLVPPPEPPQHVCGELEAVGIARPGLPVRLELRERAPEIRPGVVEVVPGGEPRLRSVRGEVAEVVETPARGHRVGLEAAPEQPALGAHEVRPGGYEVRVELHGMPQLGDRLSIGGLLPAPLPEPSPAVIGRPGLEAAGRNLRQSLPLGWRELRLERRDDGARDLGLHGEHARCRELPVERLRPHVLVGRGVDQLDVDPDLARRRAHASLHDRPDAELPGDLPDRFVRAGVRHHGGAGGDPQLVDPAQLGEQVVVDPERELAALGVVREALEREHCDGLQVGRPVEPRRGRRKRRIGPGPRRRPVRRSVRPARQREPAPDRERHDPRQREEPRGPPPGRRLRYDRVDLARRRRVRASHALGRRLKRPGEDQSNRKAEEGEERDPRGEAVREMQGRHEDVGRLEHDERHRAVDGRDAEHAPPFELGEEALVAGGLGHAREDRRSTGQAEGRTHRTQRPGAPGGRAQGRHQPRCRRISSSRARAATTCGWSSASASFQSSTSSA